MKRTIRHQTSIEALKILQEDVRVCRTRLVPELEHNRADFAKLINYFEAKFNELESNLKMIGEGLAEEGILKLKKEKRRSWQRKLKPKSKK
jgi:hypothetical protein